MVVHSGSAPFTYRWRKGGVNIPGATASTLSIPSVMQSDAGQYSLLVSNNFGFVVSNAATLTVTFTDTDGDGMQDSWETANGFNPSVNDSALDADGDGLSNLDEYLAGTNPRDPKSRVIVTVEKSPAGVGYRISFRTQANKSYTVQFKDGLGEGGWNKLNDVNATTTPQDVQLTDTPSGGTPQRFYRVVTPKQ
jgi:hypothetical protein